MSVGTEENDQKFDKNIVIGVSVGVSVFLIISLFIFIALMEYATTLFVARLNDSYKFRIRWNPETVDFVSIFLYFLIYIIFIAAYISTYV